MSDSQKDEGLEQVKQEWQNLIYGRHNSFKYFENTDYFLKKLCKKLNLQIQDEIYRARDRFLLHYMNYCVENRVVTKDLDLFKLTAWGSYLIAEEIFKNDESVFDQKAQIIFNECFKICALLLKQKHNKYILKLNADDGKHFNKIIKMLIRQIKSDKNLKNNPQDSKAQQDAQLGIGMNGLYMIVKTPSF